MPHLMAPSAAAEGEPERRGRRRGATEQAAVGTGWSVFHVTTTLDGISFPVRAWGHLNRCLASVRSRFVLMASRRRAEAQLIQPILRRLLFNPGFLARALSRIRKCALLCWATRYPALDLAHHHAFAEGPGTFGAAEQI